MNNDILYQTIESGKEFKYKEKGSLFIAHGQKILSKEHFAEIHSQIKKKYYDSTHICFAFRLFDEFRYSDDGEPNGTAGIRIFNTIKSFSLFYSAIFVIRYFGGTKLGAGPLAKAYSSAADGFVNDSGLREIRFYDRLRIHYSFENTGFLWHQLANFNAEIIGEGFTECPFIDVKILNQDSFKFANLISEVNKSDFFIDFIDSNSPYL